MQIEHCDAGESDAVGLPGVAGVSRVEHSDVRADVHVVGVPSVNAHDVGRNIRQTAGSSCPSGGSTVGGCGEVRCLPNVVRGAVAVEADVCHILVGRIDGDAGDVEAAPWAGDV